MELALDPFLSWNDIILGSSVLGQKINQPYRSRFKLDKHSGIADVETVCGREYVDDYYVFALVRHPVDRLCSLYNFVAAIVKKRIRQLDLDPKTLREGTPQELKKKYPALAWPATRAFVACDSFSDFIRHPVLYQDKSFHTQASRLRSGISGEIKGQVLKLEDQDSWLPGLKARLELDFDLPHANSSKARIAPDDLPPSDIAYIESKFAEDYQLFGY